MAASVQGSGTLTLYNTVIISLCKSQFRLLKEIWYLLEMIKESPFFNQDLNTTTCEGKLEQF
jgi:hypothetical protein